MPVMSFARKNDCGFRTEVPICNKHHLSKCAKCNSRVAMSAPTQARLDPARARVLKAKHEIAHVHDTLNIFNMAN